MSGRHDMTKTQPLLAVEVEEGPEPSKRRAGKGRGTDPPWSLRKEAASPRQTQPQGTHTRLRSPRTEDDKCVLF